MGLLAAAFLAAACSPAPAPPSGERPALPPGVLARLEFPHEGRMVGFGPFVGYYFRPDDLSDLTKLRFWCFNERGYYASDLPANALLFTGEARFVSLPEEGALPPADPAERIVPLFFDEAPAAWLATRPDPRDEYVHFHSAYDADGPIRAGFWLRHQGEAAFTLDMGGRVGPGSPLYHAVAVGPDPDFPRIVEFDRGPAR